MHKNLCTYSILSMADFSTLASNLREAKKNHSLRILLLSPSCLGRNEATLLVP